MRPFLLSFLLCFRPHKGDGLILPALAVWYRISCDSFTVKFNLVVNMSWSSSGDGRAGARVPWVENNGFEPLTPCLQSRCSSQLS